jgi:hypothetical protein
MGYLYEACDQISDFYMAVLNLDMLQVWNMVVYVVAWFLLYPQLPEGGGGYTVLPLSVLPSVQDIFRRIFLSNCWWQKSDTWSQASYRYPISWEAFLDPSDSYFLFADFVDFYKHWTYFIFILWFSRKRRKLLQQNRTEHRQFPLSIPSCVLLFTVLYELTNIDSFP